MAIFLSIKLFIFSFTEMQKLVKSNNVIVSLEDAEFVIYKQISVV